LRDILSQLPLGGKSPARATVDDLLVAVQDILHLVSSLVNAMPERTS
jgi:hypothetical protein